MGQDIENFEVGQLQQGGQGKVHGPQLPLLGHRIEIETPNWASRAYRKGHKHFLD